MVKSIPKTFYLILKSKSLTTNPKITQIAHCRSIMRMSLLLTVLAMYMYLTWELLLGVWFTSVSFLFVAYC